MCDDHACPSRRRATARRPPACSLVQVAGLVQPGFRVEIEALAVRPAPAESNDR
ncbi:hypothetical protein [Streptomyces nigrescens]|uniref:hypothetical protein n=1 Tax=Streptomyces nigrescens TaxID=1920 RepID=UPI003611B805